MKQSSTTIRDVSVAMEQWAPKGLAESYDNPGLQVGNPDRPVTKGLVALDMTPAVLNEAIERSCNLIVTHHPLIFRPISSVTSSSLVSNLCLHLAEEKIGLYSAHTNLDSVSGGVSFALAGQLGLEQISFLTHKADSVVKLVTFVPETSASQVREALTAAGTGQIGLYSGCSFSSRGEGYFTPGEGTNPVIGEPGGGPSRVDEVRIETEVARWKLSNVIQALRTAHPYEEVAYDIYPVEQSYRNAGIGAIGLLPRPESLKTFLERASIALENPALRYTGEQDQIIHKVAVCGGSGSRYISDALANGADAYLTADITYHSFFDAIDRDGTPRIALIDPGHYESERITESLIVDFLKQAFPDVPWLRTQTRTAPVATFVREIHTDSSQVN